MRHVRSYGKKKKAITFEAALDGGEREDLGIEFKVRAKKVL